MLSACISTISESRGLAKDAAKEKKSQEAKSKEEIKANDQAEFEKKKGSCMRSLCGTCWSCGGYRYHPKDSHKR